MLTGMRNPLQCPFRYLDDNRSDASVGCRLVQRLAGCAPSSGCRVSDEVCIACCRASKPTASDPNDVVASMAHAICSDKLDRATSADEFVRVSEQLTWIEQFLPDDRLGKHVVSAAKRSSTPLSRCSELIVQVGREVSQKGMRVRLESLTCLVGHFWKDWFSQSAPRIGLVGWNNLKGLGYQNRDLARWLPVQRWLVPANAFASVKVVPAEQGTARIDYLLDTDRPRRTVRRWLQGLDVLLFVETLLIDGLTAQARAIGIRIVCVPNWEWLHPGLEWLRDVDRMLCPTVFTQQLMEDWKRRFGFQWNVRYCPWPIDPAAFPFRLRAACRRFVSVIGTDRRRPPRLNGTPTDTRRKGLEVLLEAARRLPHIPFLIWAQTDDLPPFPSNVELRMSPANNADLYQDGDVCVQLSRWEGLGLPLLECQAAGMPLITIDAPPMNEHNPLAVVPVADSEVLELWPRRFIAAPVLRIEDVVSVLSAWFGQDIQDASRAAREFVERDHSWSNSRLAILDVVARTPAVNTVGDF